MKKIALLTAGVVVSTFLTGASALNAGELKENVYMLKKYKEDMSPTVYDGRWEIYDETIFYNKIKELYASKNSSQRKNEVVTISSADRDKLSVVTATEENNFSGIYYLHETGSDIYTFAKLQNNILNIFLSSGMYKLLFIDSNRIVFQKVVE